MRQTSGIIINEEIFINSSHVVKIDYQKISDNKYELNIYLTNTETPIIFTFDTENDCVTTMKKIIMEMYGFNFAYVNFETAE